MSPEHATQAMAQVRKHLASDLYETILDIMATAIAEGIDNVNEGQPLTARDHATIAQTIIDSLDQEGFHVRKK